MATAVVVSAIVLNVDEEAMWNAVGRADWRPAALSLFLTLPNFLVAGWAWWRIARRIDASTRYAEALWAVVGSHALGFWTPARIGEFAGRGWIHGRGDGWAWASGVGLEAFLRCGPPFLLGGLAVLAIGPRPLAAWQVTAVVSLVLFVIVLGIATRPQRLYGWLVRRKGGHGLAFLQSMTPSDTVAAMAANGVRMTIGAVQLALLAVAFGAAPSFGWLLAAGLATLSVKNLVPNLTLGDLGVREASAGFFFAALGVDSAVGVDAALGLYAVNILIPAAVGALLMPRIKRTT